jgi:membrane-associated phospholipid phosphatase
VLRRSEWQLILYFSYTSFLALFLEAPASVPAVTLLVNAAVICGFVYLAWADSFRRGLLLGTIRDWFPLLLTLLAYREMGWFAPKQHTHYYENVWIVVDRWFLYALGVKGAIESLGPVLPAILELSYSLVYVLAPFSMAMLYVYRRRERSEIFLSTFVLGVLVAYAQFPLWPSEPPRTVFEGQDLPAYLTVFRRFNLGLLGSYGIHLSVFPSAHVSGAFASALGMKLALPEKPWIWRLLLAMAVLIATATVYGRYHYFLDALAGASMAALLWAGTHWRARREKPTL